jgi:ABC-type Fe3+-hydroxamate transport system substrate-binding protein
MKVLETLVFATLAVFCPGVVAQTQPAPPAAAAQRSQVAGTVTVVDASNNQVTLKTDKGEVVAIATTEKTLVLHMPPGESDPKKGNKMLLSSLGPGDRVVAIVRQATPDQQTMQASSLIVRTKADLAELQQKDQDEWKKRGTTGTVTATDATAKTATVKVGQRSITVQPSDKTVYHRYSLDSARFSDAKASSFGEIHVGDQMRVLGDKSEDGSVIKAEKIVSGSFRQIAATITSIDASTGEIKVKDLATKKPLTIRVSADSIMKKLPDQAARMLARRYGQGAQGAGAGQGDGQGAGGGAGRGMGGGRGGDVGQMLDSLPALPLSELKAGDAVMVSTTQGSDPGRVTAIMLLAGVEPLLTASPNATRDIMSGWNLGGGGDTGGQ